MPVLSIPGLHSWSWCPWSKAECRRRIAHHCNSDVHEEDWPSGCLPNEDAAWNSVWNGELANVRFATLTENSASNFDGVRYTCHEINKAEEDVWLVYPWENVAEY